MNLVGAFLRLIRWQNLVFIVLTQALFYFCIYYPLYRVHNFKRLIFLVLASVFIAAAGYIINDYFDLNIDRINKPNRLIVQKIISRRWAIVWHFFLSMAGVAIGFYLDLTTRVTLLGFSNLVCACLLFLYSIS